MRILQLINLCNEFCDKTGKEVDDTEKTFAIWLFLDEESRLKAERKNLIEGTTPFSAVCDVLDQISSDQHWHLRATIFLVLELSYPFGEK